VQFTVAITTITELGDLTSFDNPRQLMSYLGLTPSEYSSGDRRRLGGIAKAGNGHARRVLIARELPAFMLAIDRAQAVSA
jgi:transposase